MPLNFNVSPYFDDFQSAKNYHRILFKPGAAVQARELTQSQTILQNQISSFADNIFKQNSPVTGGQITTNFNCNYVKLLTTYNSAAIDVTQFTNKIVQDATGTIIAQVIAVSPATLADPPTLILSYKSGNQFGNGSVIYDTQSNLAAQAIAVAATGSSSVASIAQGVFYIASNYTDPATGYSISNGIFVEVTPQTIILDKYDSVPSLRVGLYITETIIDYITDSSLLDPAVGASNYQAPGADRYKISLTLQTRPIPLGQDDGFIPLLIINSGFIQKIIDGSVYNVIDDYFAKRDYETNGDYVVNDFKLTPKTNTSDYANSTYTLSIGKGLAYVHGYRVESTSPADIITNRAKTTLTQNNNPVFIDIGSYLYVDTVNGANGYFFDTSTYAQIDLHTVSAANVNTASACTYNSTLVSSGYIRGLIYDHNTSDGNANSYVYRAYVSDLQNQAPTANVVSSTTNTFTLPSYFSAANNAYVGVNVSIINGTDSGDFRIITAYNGSTKVATINQNWTVSPDTTSVFVLNFGVKDTNTVIYANKASYPATIYGTANINVEGRANGVSTGTCTLENPAQPELIFPVGNPYVSGLSGTSYTTQQVWRNVSFTASGSGVGASLPYTGDYNNVIRHFGTLSSTIPLNLIEQNYTIVVTNKGSSSLTVGQIIPWNTAGRTATLDSTGSTITFNITDAGGSFTATIVAKVFVENGDNTGHILRNKYLITGNTSVAYTSGTQVNTYTFVDDTPLTSTGQIYIQNAGLVTPGNKQSLYLADVKSVIKVLDTVSSGVTPTTAGLSSYKDISNNYIFDNGQRDNYYDHSGITLKPGAPQPSGNILVFVNYYQQTGGDGYFDVNSYTNDVYQLLPTYTSKAGITYALRDCLDFRPARKNAQTSFVFRYSNSAASNYGTFLPIDLTTFIGNYSYYLGRKDKLVLTKDKSFKVIEGTASNNPIFPSEPDGSLVLAELTHNPYTGYLPTEAPNGYVPDLSIVKVKHKRYTMEDISGLESRINNLEYYTSLSLLEQNANSLQVSDAFGLNRFKNGIMVDDFSTYATADTLSNDYFATINRRTRQMTAAQNVRNFPLKALAQVFNMGAISTSTTSNLGYSINNDGYVNYFSLPITGYANVASQVFASRTINVNPFSVTNKKGILTISPNVDNWVDTNYAPSLLITDPNLQVFRAGNNINVLSVGDYQTVSGTVQTTVSSQDAAGFVNQFQAPAGSVLSGVTQTTTYTSQVQNQNNTIGAYDKIGNTYSINNNYITDISILPYIRPQQIAVSASGLLFNTTLNSYFDNISVNNYIRKANIIELNGVSGSFNVGDIIGYYNSPTFVPTGVILGIYTYSSTKVRLYVVGEPNKSTTYQASGTFQNGFYNTGGTYQNSTASGTIASTNHFAGRLTGVNGASTVINLSSLASSVDGYYNGQTIYFVSGTGQNQTATITSYVGSTQAASITASFVSVGDTYSIGSFSSNETGHFYGVFYLPANVFHTGQRTLRIDNGVYGNPTTATTYAESVYYAEGLQTNAQAIDFAASPSGAKDTFTQINSQTINTINTSYTPTYGVLPPSGGDSFGGSDGCDPVAQTFSVDAVNYPNGVFLNSIKLFFRTKANDGSPIHLSIVGTTNGYPNGSTLDHSISTLTPDMINISENPQYLDSSAYTTFMFSAPVYIQPNILYAFIVKSNSKDYNLWSAALNDTPIASSAKNYPTDPTPAPLPAISSAPYSGSLFLSQNSQTWTADQNQDLMFVMDRCIFNTNVTPTIQYVVPKKLPQRTLLEQSIDYFINANNVSNTVYSVSNTSIFVDAFNFTTTDFVPTTTGITYSYNASLVSGVAAGQQVITPGKFATTAADNIYLSDGKGERFLNANSNTSLSLYAQLSSNDSCVSPIISDAGLTTYTISWNINNCPLSNSLITLTNGGTGYSNNTSGNTTVTISAPTGASGTQAYASANVSGGVIQNIYITNPGSGYITTPTITIIDANTTPGSGATSNITGETSSSGGPATAKYVTKKVVLAPGFDSGDLNVYLTAYRPVNTDINVYYKILNGNDTQSFENGQWQLMTKINNSGNAYSQTRNNLYEYVFAPGTLGLDQGFVKYTSTNGQNYTSFNQFAIKIILTTTDNTTVPYVNDMRVLALPVNVDTTF